MFIKVQKLHRHGFDVHQEKKYDCEGQFVPLVNF